MAAVSLVSAVWTPPENYQPPAPSPEYAPNPFRRSRPLLPRPTTFPSSEPAPGPIAQMGQRRDSNPFLISIPQRQDLAPPLQA